MTARSRHTENSAFVRRTGPRVLAGLLRKGNGGARGERNGGGGGGGSKKAFLSLSLFLIDARRPKRGGPGGTGMVGGSREATKQKKREDRCSGINQD